MSFAIFSDSSCNLPKAQLEEFQVQIISSSNYLSPLSRGF